MKYAVLLLLLFGLCNEDFAQGLPHGIDVKIISVSTFIEVYPGDPIYDYFSSKVQASSYKVIILDLKEVNGTRIFKDVISISKTYDLDWTNGDLAVLSTEIPESLKTIIFQRIGKWRSKA